MLLALVLSVASWATCDQDFHARVAPPGAPPPPPLERLLPWVYDADDSHSLDAAEKKAMDADLAARCDALAALFAEVDTDGDGRLSDAEREGLEAISGRPPRPPEGPPPAKGALPPPLIEAYDADRDGELSAAERAAARADLRGRLRDGLPPIPPAGS